MYNTSYNYDTMYLWDPKTWEPYHSPFSILSQYIEEINHKHYRVQAGIGPYSDRKDGWYDGKTYSYFYQDYIERWEKEGLHFHSTEQGSVYWDVMLPTEVRDKKEHNPKVLVVLCDVDISDPNWSIHMLLQHEKYNELAAKHRFVPLYICCDDVNRANVPINIMQEFSVIYNVMMQDLYVDVSPLTELGISIKDIQGYTYTDRDGNEISEPDSCIEDFYGIPALNITGRWQNQMSLLMDIRSPWIQHKLFDPDKFIHTQAGREMAEELMMEYRYHTADTPGFKENWERMGVEFARHDYKGYQWISYVPKAYIGQNQELLPAVLLFQEVTYQDPHQIVAGAATYKNYIELAATGELILLMFALESVEDNDMYIDILDQAEKIYPIDLSRVYVTGQSHNGYFTDEFVRRHHERIAACAPLSNHLGIPEDQWSTSFIKVSDEQIDRCCDYEMPTIIVTSTAENRNGKIHCRDDETFEHAAKAYQRRLKANNCPVKTVEEINAVIESENYIERNIMYPVDRTFFEFRQGTEVFIGEVKNKRGRYFLRFAVLGNQTHFVAPQMPELSWEFMRRFARDLKTGEVIVRY